MSPAQKQRKLTGAEVAKHNTKDSCWVIVHGKVYDVTDFLPGTKPPVTVAQKRRLIIPQSIPVARRSSSSMQARMRRRSSTPSTPATPSTSTSTRRNTWARST